MIIDTHTHVIAPDRDAYPFQRRAGGGLSWPIDHPVSAEQLESEMDAAAVDAAVLVQASVYGDDNRYIAHAAAEAPGRFVGLGIVDVAGPGRGAAAATLCATGGCAGVRMFDVPSSQPSWLDDGRAAEVAVATNEVGGVSSVCVLAPALSRFGDLAREVGDVPLVLEHCGFADFSGGPPFDRATDLWKLIEYPNVIVKVTTTSMDPAADAGMETADLVRVLADRFGADRLMWGSDYPQHHSESYARIVSAGKRSAARLSDGERAAYLSGTATRLWPSLVGNTR